MGDLDPHLFRTPWHFISNMAFLKWRWMHILHNILYLKVSYTGRNVIPNIYSILVKASYYPLALFFCSILQLDLCGASKNVKTNSIRTMLFFLFRIRSKIIFFPHYTVTWFHRNTNQIEDICIKSTQGSKCIRIIHWIWGVVPWRKNL